MQISNSATTSEITALFDAARAQKKAILLKGYTSSDGKVIDYTFLPLPRGGYADIAKASHDLLQKDNADPFLDRAGHPSDIWRDASAAKCASFFAAFNSPPTAGGDGHGFKSSHTLTRVDANVFESTSEPGTTVIAHLGCYSMDVRLAPEKKASGRPRDPIVVCKEHIDKQLPIDDYLGQLILKPGKYASAELVDADVTSWTFKLFYA